MTALRSLLLFLLFSGTSAAPAATVVENGPEPVHPPRSVILEELWRIGGLEDEDNLLGLVDGAAVDEEGNVYLLDTQLVTVQVFDSRGRFITSLGRKGEGPGEIRQASEVLLLPDGTVGLMQTFPGRIVKVDRSGLPAGELDLGKNPGEGGLFTLLGADYRGGNLVLAGSRITREESIRYSARFIGSFDPSGNERAVYHRATLTMDTTSGRRDEAAMFFPNRTWAVGPEGEVYIAPERNEYRIEAFAPGGEHRRTITLPYESLERTPQELAAARSWMTPQGRRNLQALEVVVEPTQRDIVQMHVAADLRLWVLSSRGAHPDDPGIHSLWDVFDPEGRFDHQASLPCEGRALEDAVFFAGEDLVILVKEHTDALYTSRSIGRESDEGEGPLPLEVVCYRMTD
ncbi:hypothetical protein KJ682_09310 [bacterium]|nr:hypothetical protein [bacterium]